MDNSRTRDDALNRNQSSQRKKKKKTFFLYDGDKNGFAISAKRKSKTRFSEQSYLTKKFHSLSKV